jgi:hypothetical protein
MGIILIDIFGPCPTVREGKGLFGQAANSNAIVLIPLAANIFQEVCKSGSQTAKHIPNAYGDRL